MDDDDGPKSSLKLLTSQSYEQVDVDQLEVPQSKPMVRQQGQEDAVIFQKYKNSQKTIFRNLDTGEAIQIDFENDGDEVLEGVSAGLKNLSNRKLEWDLFWNHVNNNNNLLKHYCQDGMFEEAQALLAGKNNQYPVQVNFKGLDNWTPLHYAAYEGFADIIQMLLKYGANIEAVNSFKRNALHIASIKNHISVVKMLVKHKININASDFEGNTALHFAAENKYADLVKYLLSCGVEMKQNNNKFYPYHQADDEKVQAVFRQAGYEEKDDIEIKKKITKSNKVQKSLICATPNLSTDDFNFYKALGQGTFGQVFLVQKKGQNKLLAMKVLSKQKMLADTLQRYAITQRDVLSVISHPFMAKLHYAFQSHTKLFLVMQYYPGGDLGKLISKRKTVSEDEARLYISQLILAIEALHKNMIVFRDLKPENVILDSEGHCILTDFGLSKQGIYNNSTGSFCGSVAYLAPQILSRQGHSRTVDWYLLGLLLYQLIVGQPPYYSSKRQQLFENIKRGALKIPKNMSAQARDIIKKLLCRDPRKRLGAENDSQDLKTHPFFAGVNWSDVLQRKQVMPPIDEPKINFNETLPIDFGSSKQGSQRVEGWTFIKQV